MKQLLHFSLHLILLGGLAVAWPAEAALTDGTPQQVEGGSPLVKKENPERETQGPPSPPPSPQEGEMMSMMSREHEMMGTMLNTMREMAQILKEQTKEADAKARTDQVLAQIKKMEDQHKMMMGMMNMMMSDHGGGR